MTKYQTIEQKKEQLFKEALVKMFSYAAKNGEFCSYNDCATWILAQKEKGVEWTHQYSFSENEMEEFKSWLFGRLKKICSGFKDSYIKSQVEWFMFGFSWRVENGRLNKTT